MKKARLFLFLFFMIAALLYVIEKGFVHRFLEKKITSFAQENGWEVEMKGFQGIPPLSLHIEEMKLLGHGVKIDLEKIDLTPSWVSLLQGKILFHLRTKTIDLGQESLENLHLFVKWQPKKMEAHCNIFFRKIPIELDLKYQNQGGGLGLKLLSHEDFFTIKKKEDGFDLQGADSQILLRPSSLHFSTYFAKIDAYFKENLSIDFQIDNLHELTSAFFPIYGKTSGNIVLTPSDLSFEGEGKEIYFDSFYFQSIHFSKALQEASHFDFQKGSFHKLKIDQMKIDLTREENDFFAYEVDLHGNWHHPLFLHFGGKIDIQGKGVIDRMVGNFYHHPFLMTAITPFSLQDFGPFNLQFDQGTFQANLERTSEKKSLSIELKEFPLDLLSLNPLEVDIQGKVTSSLFLEEIEKKLTGQWKAHIEESRIGSLETSGQIEGTLQGDQLSLQGFIGQKEKELLAIQLLLPMEVSLKPLSLHLLEKKPIEGRFDFDGKIEELLDFFDLGMHRIEGIMHCHLLLDGNFSSPLIKGTCLIEKGLYENYQTGFQLNDFALEALGKGDFLQMHFEALDATGLGKIEADGSMQLWQDEKFPFEIKVEWNHFTIQDIDLMSGILQGQAILKGNLSSADLQGNMELFDAKLEIPGHIPRKLPELTVVYQNQIKPTKKPTLSTSSEYPISLDFDIKAPGGIKIFGKGLDSKWDGSFHLSGTNQEFQAEGRLDLIEGEFKFASRNFKLTDGSLSMKGTHGHEVPYLNLAGLVQVKDVEIAVRLKGPLNRPQITFQSSPPLPMSSIVSYLLFGQEVSEINSFQALQLAATIVSFAGEGPDVLEKTRKALGVDRLEILTVPAGEEGLRDTLAIQVGKYIGEGVLVSFTQGAEDSGPNINIEIEIPKGLVIQLESDQRQEQGKFTLKWNYNY